MSTGLPFLNKAISRASSHDSNTKYPEAGKWESDGILVRYGVRNPSADNFGAHDSNGNPIIDDDGNVVPATYDNGTATFTFDINPTRDGALSEDGDWRWNGQ